MWRNTENKNESFNKNIMGSTANRVIKNTGFLYAKMGITMFISLYTTRLILNSLGASDFGIFNIVGGAIAMLGFINSSMAGSTQRFMSYAAGQGLIEKQKHIFNISYVIHIALALFATLIFIIVGYWLFNGILNIPDGRQIAAIAVYGCLIVSTFFTMISVPYEAVLNAHENMKYYAIVGIFESFLKLLVAFAIFNSPIDKLIYYGILMSLIPIIVLSIMRIYCHKRYAECKISLYRYWDKSLAKEMTGFAGWGAVSSAFALLTMQGMSILLNIFGGVVVNAAHGVANQLAGQLMVFSNNMLKALNPVIVKSRGAGENAKMLEAASTGNKLSFLIFSFFAIPFIVETPTILRLWLKEPPEWSVLFVRLVLIRQMISQMFITYETCIKATGKIRQVTVLEAFVWTFPIFTGYFMYKVGAPIYTIYILLIIMNFMRMANTLYFCRKLCKLKVNDFFMKTMLPCIIQSIILLSSLIFIGLIINASLLRLFTILAFSCFLHPLLSYLFSLNTKERNIINGIIKNKIIHI